MFLIEAWRERKNRVTVFTCSLEREKERRATVFTKAWRERKRRVTVFPCSLEGEKESLIFLCFINIKYKKYYYSPVKNSVIILGKQVN